MSIYSLVGKTVEQGGWTGVCRFDRALRSVFPELQSVTRLPQLQADDVVITDNHLSLDVPPESCTVVVHHGCAQTHYERDLAWRNDGTRRLVEAQRTMFELPNRIWVAPSAWVADEFRKVSPSQRTIHVIPHWVEIIERSAAPAKPRIIGDWRNLNKGVSIWRELAARCPQWDFQPLNFRDDDGRRQQYGEASLYLCLSASEGGSYAMCDAEAAGLPIVTTDVGNYREFFDCEVISWLNRYRIDAVAAAITRKLRAGRKSTSVYDNYTFDDWKQAWERVIQ